MQFLVDAQLPPALARRLTALGHQAEHVADCGLAQASDAAIWDHAMSIGAILVTKDEDFSQRKVLDSAGPKIVWIRLANTRRRELLVWFEAVLSRLLQALERGETLVEIV